MSKENKSKITLATQEAKTVIESFTQLIEALSLITVSIVAITAARDTTEYWQWPVLVAGAVIAIRGGLEFIKYLKRGK